MKKLLIYLRSPRLNSPILRRTTLVLTCLLLGSVVFTGYRLAMDISVVQN